MTQTDNSIVETTLARISGNLADINDLALKINLESKHLEEKIAEVQLAVEELYMSLDD